MATPCHVGLGHSDLFDIRVMEKTLESSGLKWEQEATIRVDNYCSVYKPICRGVRQGCIFSPGLFNIYCEKILRNIEQHEGLSRW